MPIRHAQEPALPLCRARDHPEALGWPYSAGELPLRGYAQRWCQVFCGLGQSDSFPLRTTHLSWLHLEHFNKAGKQQQH